MKNDVLLLGLGMQGKAALYDLSKSEYVNNIIVVDSNPKIEEELKKYNSDKVKGFVIDIVNQRDKIVSLMKNVDVVVDLLPSKFTFEIAKIAAEVGVNLVSAMYFNDPAEEDPARIKERETALKELDKIAQQKDIILLSEFGLDPGLDLILGKKAISEFDEVHDFYSYGAGFPEFSAANNPLKYKFTWSIIGVLLSYNRPATIIKDGKVIEIPAREIFEQKNVHILEIEQLSASVECYPNGNSAHYAEIMGIKNTVKNMGRFTCRWPGHVAFWEKMVKCGFLSKEPISVRDQKVIPIEFCAALLGNQEQFHYGPSERDIAFIRIDVKGICRGKNKRVIYQIIDFRDMNTGLTAMSRTTGFTAAIGAELILKGDITKKGLLTPLDVPFSIIEKEVTKRGIKIDYFSYFD